MEDLCSVCWYCWGASECIRNVASAQCGNGSRTSSMTSRTSRESKPRPVWSRRPRWRHAGTGCKHHVRDTRSALVGRSDFCAGLGGISWEATEQPPRKAESYRRQSESCHRFHRRDGVERPPIHLEMRTTSAPTVGLQCEADATVMGTAKLEPTAQRFGG